MEGAKGPLTGRSSMWTSDPAADGATRMRTWATPSGPNEASSTILAGRSAARTVVLSGRWLVSARAVPRRV